MYGYIRIYKPELRFREFDCYQGCYCGLCQSLRQQYGIAARWTLSYDMTFLILLLSGLYEPEEQHRQQRCIAHPIHKRLQIQSEVSAYAADMSILLFREKCMDDWLDERNYSRRVAAGILRRSYQKAQAKHPEKAAIIRQELLALHQLEQQQEQNPDLPAGCFGRLLAEIFAWKQDIWAPVLREIGFYLGKFIYLLDAYDDLERDRKKGCYNPLLTLAETGDDLDARCEQMLEMMIAPCAAAFERLPVLTHADTLRNILYAGAWAQFRQARAKKQAHSKAEEKEQ